MLLRRISALLSLLAVGFLALACSLGYQSDPEKRKPQRSQATTTQQRSKVITGDVCVELDRQVSSCQQDLLRIRYPQDFKKYSGRVLQLVQVSRKLHLGEDAAQMCKRAKRRDDTSSVSRCLQRSTCGGFATCLADNF